MMEMFNMGDYGPYVWSCFGLTAFVVGIIEWRARQRHKIMAREIEVRLRAMEGRE